MKKIYPYILALIVVALLAVPVVAAETNATNTTSTTAIANTTAVTTTTTEVPATTTEVPATTTLVANATSTSTPNTTATQNATVTITTPVTTVAATPALSEGPKATGEIAAASSPLGAALLIDGVYYGTTPVTLNNIPVGNHIVRLTLSGYYDYEGSIYVTPDTVTNVFGTLQPSGSSATVQPQTTAVITTATVQPTQTTAAGLFDSPTVIAAMIGIITACIGAGATIFTHMKK